MAAGQQLGSLLVGLGFIDQDQLESALEEQQRSSKRLGKILVDAGVITEERLVLALSRQLGIEICDPLTAAIHERVLALIPIELAYRHRVIPVALKKEDAGEILFVATSDPLNKTALSELRSAVSNRRVRWLLAGETAMEMALARHYGAAPKRSSRPLPEGTPVITGKPVAAPKTKDLPISRPSQPPIAALSAAASSDLLTLSNDLGGLMIPSEELPPIDVPPELLASPDAALQIIEAEMPRPINGALEELEMVEAEPVEVEPIELEPVELVPVEADTIRPAADNGHQVTSWGDLLGSDLLVPPPANLKPLPTQEVEDDRIEVVESVEEVIEPSYRDGPPRPHPSSEPIEEADPIAPHDSGLPAPFDEEVEESVDLEEDPEEEREEMISELAARVKEVAQQVATAASAKPIPVVEMGLDPTEVGSPPVDDTTASPSISDATTHELSRAAVMRQVLVRFIEEGSLDIGPQAVLRVIAAILEQEGLLTEERIARAMGDDT